MFVSSRQGVETVEGDEHVAGKQSTVVSVVVQAVSNDRPRLCMEELDLGPAHFFYSPVCAFIQQLQDVLQG